MSSPSYEDKLKAIRNYTALGIKSKKNFTPQQKRLITRYYNLAKGSGYFEYNEKNNEFIAKVKFVKSKKKKQKGAPRLKGYIIQGAAPGDKIINGKIIKNNFEKIFIPLDFSDLPPATDDNDDEFDAYVYEEVFDGLTPYFEELKSGDYFTIVLQNGWELGQRKNIAQKKAGKNYTDGQAIAEDLEGDAKFMNLVDKIIEQLKQGVNKYQTKMPLVKGIYLWKFRNQRQPTNKEKRAINGKRKRKRKNH